jgi:hypothetical protein
MTDIGDGVLRILHGFVYRSISRSVLVTGPVAYIHTCAKVLSPEPDLISFIKLHATTAAVAVVVVAAIAYDEVSLRLLEMS